MQPLLFDLFDRAGEAAADAPHRLGTGLAIVARLARLHGGSVRVESAGKDLGSTFVLRLPLAAPASAAAGASGERDAQAAPPPVRLLIVDDNVDAADAIGTLLALNGFEVATAHDPDAAMERAIAVNPDVILLDIGLPGMTGYELARKLRAHPDVAHARLIALTGYGRAEDAEQAQEAGFDGYLVKPVDAEQLRLRIDAILAVDGPGGPRH